VRVFRTGALAAADASDRLRAAGVVPSPLAGIPVSVKDLFDLAGVTTLAGSATRKDEAPAARDATVVARMRSAGAVIVGSTNMVEFALGGTGLNPHFGDCRNPWDRATGRIPGGSSSGAAVSVTDDMAAAALGTDTMGSVRIPAGFCGLAGFKPSAARVPRDGVFPLSTTLDSVGPLARSTQCCALVDAVLAGEHPVALPALPVAGLRLGIATTIVMDDLESAVVQAFQRAVSRLSAAGAKIEEFAFPELAEIAAINRAGGLSVIESYAHHRRWLDTRGRDYDPRVLTRMKRGAGMSAADYYDVLQQRADLVVRGSHATRNYDAVIMPTLALVAPPIAKFTATQEALVDPFGIAIRNTSVANYLDRCALSIPCHQAGTGPVGFTLMGECMGDRRLLAVGAAVEPIVSRDASP
jgi:aspartyl-tRNA(Asn)/glutamyl-tRNA(Gln) amidotransferase subunit A